VGFPRGGLWRVRFNGDWEGYSPDFTNRSSNDVWASDEGADTMPFAGNAGLGPYSAVIFSQDA
jgi:1,4-alpha-glucan branching enzyme